MPEYQNTTGRSSVTSYSVGNNSITVTFKDGGSYTYNASSLGLETLNQMIALAKSGQGLNGFINTQVKDDFDNAQDFE